MRDPRADEVPSDDPPAPGGDVVDVEAEQPLVA